MKAEIIAVGSELLKPDFQDTDSLFLTRRLDDLGLEVVGKAVVGDRKDEIRRAIGKAMESADLVVLTGGLGPTGDDLTRDAVAEALGRPLLFDPAILSRIEERFAFRGLPCPESNRRQAYVLSGAEVLANRNGTAPGLWVEEAGKIIILLPGPPHELEGIFEEQVWPRLWTRKKGATAQRLLRTTGLTESEVEERVSDLYPDNGGLRLTVLASPGVIDLRVTALTDGSESEASEKAEALAAELRRRLGSYLYSENEDPLEAVVGSLLLSRRLTLATAESCTGGLLGHRLTEVPGSSAYYLGGFIVYGNASKVRELGVPEELLESRGAVSMETAEAMARGARIRMEADLALGVTGIAGPGGGTREKPVGLVHIALAASEKVDVSTHRFLGRRGVFKFQSTQKALDILRRRLLGLPA